MRKALIASFIFIVHVALCEEPAATTILGCKLSQPSCRPGLGVTITYRWDAKPADKDYEPFVHIHGPNNAMFQGDHLTPTPTTKWSGRIEYEQTLITPADAPVGEYHIQIGLWDRKTGGRLKLQTAEGATDAGGNAY